MAEDQAILVHWLQDVAAVMDWATFCEYRDDFCYPMSDVVIWPLPGERALLYHHEEQFTFGVRANGPIANPTGSRA